MRVRRRRARLPGDVPGLMPRPYHSPSSIALGMRCQRAWAYHYIANLREPYMAWREDMALPRWDHGKGKFILEDGTLVTAAQRGAALGGVMHEVGERYLDPRRGVPDWASFPGQVFQSGTRHLPRPERIKSVLIESAIGREPLAKRPGKPRHDREPTHAITIHGGKWAGYRDALIDAPEEWHRLGLHTERPVIVDYKSTSNIAARALTPDELSTDVQASIYAIDYCEATGDNAAAMRWIYFEAKKIRRSLPVDTIITLASAYGTLSHCADLARELDTLTRVEDAPQNPDACNDYGDPERINCRFHRVNGGPCNARRPNRFAPVQIKKKEEIQMAMTAEQKAEFAAKKAAQAAKANTATNEAKSEETEGEETEETETAPAKSKAVTPKPAAGPKATKPAEGSTAATVAALAGELAAIDKSRDQVLAKIRAAVA